jgi:hypothetical protein
MQDLSASKKRLLIYVKLSHAQTIAKLFTFQHTNINNMK